MPFQMHTLGFFYGPRLSDHFYMKKLILVTLLFLFAFADDAYAFEKASGSSAKIAVNKQSLNSDYRVKVLRDYLNKYNSPLTDSADEFVLYADQNNLDWRLVAAISGVESTFGHQIPYNTYNAWGWGIYGTNMYYFKSWEDGISTISKGLRTNYIDKWGAQNIYQIGKFYAASPTWAQRVVYFMNKIGDFGVKNPEKTLSLTI
jgi:hypothetical protein